MTQKIPVLIYGDSIMKATVVEQGGKMKFTFQQYVQQLEQAGLEVWQPGQIRCHGGKRPAGHGAGS